MTGKGQIAFNRRPRPLKYVASKKSDGRRTRAKNGFGMVRVPLDLPQDVVDFIWEKYPSLSLGLAVRRYIMEYMEDVWPIDIQSTPLNEWE